MENNDLDKIIKELRGLREEVSQLRKRLDTIEGKREEKASVPPRTEPTPPPRPVEIKTPKKPAAERGELEAKIGGKWLNRIGILAVIIGMGFFIKYAFDNDWIGETGRVVLGIIIGLALIGWGEYLKKKYKVYSQGVVGGGIAILYISIFAAAAYYDIIFAEAGYFLTVAVTIFAIILSVRYDAPAIATLGFLGGFLNPLIISSGDIEQIPTLTYVALLDLGILTLAYFKDWKFLNIFSFLATAFIFLFWAEQSYTDHYITSTQIFLIVFFAIFASISIFYNVIYRKMTSILDLIFIFVIASAFFGASYINLEDQLTGWMGLFSGLMGLIYFGLSFITEKRHSQDRKLVLTFLAVALAFVVIMIPIQLEGSWITIGWAVEAAALVWIGIRVKNRGIRIAGIMLFAATVLKLLFGDLNIDIYDENFSPFLNQRFLTVLFVSLTAFLAAYFYSREKESLKGEINVGGVLFVVANLLVIMAFSIEAYDYFEHRMIKLINGEMIYLYDPTLKYAQNLVLSGIWALYSAVLVALGFIKKNKLSRIFAIALFGVTIFKVFIFDLSSLQKFYRIISFIGLGVILLSVSFLYTRYRDIIIEAVIGDEKEGDDES